MACQNLLSNKLRQCCWPCLLHPVYVKLLVFFSCSISLEVKGGCSLPLLWWRRWSTITVSNGMGVEGGGGRLGLVFFLTKYETKKKERAERLFNLLHHHKNYSGLWAWYQRHGRTGGAGLWKAAVSQRWHEQTTLGYWPLYCLYLHPSVSSNHRYYLKS